MKTKISYFLMLSFFLSSDINAQSFNLDSNSKKIVSFYKGGRKKYSRVSIIFYSDSSFIYNNRYHTGQSEKDSGKYSMTDSSVILFSKDYVSRKKHTKKVKTYLFTGQKYRIE
jgi:hypothetical protein